MTLERINVDLLMRVLVYISDHYAVAEPDLRDITGASRASNIRMLKYARENFGVVIDWRRDNTLPSRGEYSVLDWGVFNESAVRRFLRRQK